MSAFFNYFKIFLLLFLLLTKISFSSCENDANITIFIHGIVKPPITIQDLIRIKKDRIKNTQFAYSVEYLRESPDTFTFQPMQELGLKQIDLDDNSPGNSATAIARIYELQSNDNAKNYYYTFGWSALLSRSSRQQEGLRLLKSLKKEINRLNLKNPNIRIIGYSHGGNVALNLARFVPKDNLPFIVNELILVGMPIQKETDFLINHPIFKNVYNIYSMADIAQRADKFSTRYFFSHRKFWPRRDFIVPDKLKQIQIKVVKIYFDTCDKVKQKKVIGPKHSELWQFGWAPKAYRKRFPITPLSVSSLIPTILEKINEIENVSNDLSVTINTYEGIIKIKDRKTKNKYNFNYNKSYFDDLKNLAYEFKIEYPYCDYAALVKDAMIYALRQRLKFKKANCIEG